MTYIFLIVLILEAINALVNLFIGFFSVYSLIQLSHFQNKSKLFSVHLGLSQNKLQCVCVRHNIVAH